MIKLFNAFMFKLTRDLTFRIMLIIGASLAVLTATIFFILDQTGASASMGFGQDFKVATGQSMLVFSMSPAQNFGIAIPINLAVFIVLEFTQGTIRNKVIVGNSKFKIYASTYLCGLVFAIAIMLVYVGVCFALGSLSGGFDANGMAFTSSGAGKVSPQFLFRLVIVTIMTYFTTVAFTTFVATLFRNVGPCIPLVVIPITMLAMLSLITTMTLAGVDTGVENNVFIENLANVSKFLNPLHAACGYEVNFLTDVPLNQAIHYVMSNDTFVAAIINNLIYTALFFTLGAFIFAKRDIK